MTACSPARTTLLIQKGQQQTPSQAAGSRSMVQARTDKTGELWRASQPLVAEVLPAAPSFLPASGSAGDRALPPGNCAAGRAPSSCHPAPSSCQGRSSSLPAPPEVPEDTRPLPQVSVLGHSRGIFLFLRNRSKTSAEAPAASEACSWRKEEQQWSQRCLLSLKKGSRKKPAEIFAVLSGTTELRHTPGHTLLLTQLFPQLCRQNVPWFLMEGVLGYVTSQRAARLASYPQQSLSECGTSCQRLAHPQTGIYPQEAEFTSKASIPLCLSGVTALTQF